MFSFCGNESKLGKWDVKRAITHTVKKFLKEKLIYQTLFLTKVNKKISCLN